MFSRSIGTAPGEWSRRTMDDTTQLVDDRTQLEELNEQFIEAFRRGSWELLEPILAPSFSYLDGASGDVWEHERYVESLRSHAAPALALDQVVIHIGGGTAVVSDRTSRQPGG